MTLNNLNKSPKSPVHVPAPLLQTSIKMVQIETSQMDVGHMKMSWVGAVLSVQGAEEEKLFNGMFIATAVNPGL